MNDTVECPYCEHENDMTDALSELSSDNTTDWECSKCGEEFEVHVEFEPSFSAGKIVYEDCEKCGDKTRDIKEKGRVFPWPGLIREKKICRTCFGKAHSEWYERMNNK